MVSMERKKTKKHNVGDLVYWSRTAGLIVEMRLDYYVIQWSDGELLQGYLDCDIERYKKELARVAQA